MTRLIIIRGQPGAGKSEIARRVHAQLNNAVLVHKDPLVRSANYSQTNETQAGIVRATLSHYLKNHDVLFEGLIGNMKKWQFLLSLSDDVKLISLQVSEDVSKARADTRLNHHIAEPMDAATWKKFYDMYNSCSEGLSIDTTDLSVEQVLEKVISYLDMP